MKRAELEQLIKKSRPDIDPMIIKRMSDKSLKELVIIEQARIDNEVHEEFMDSGLVYNP